MNTTPVNKYLFEGAIVDAIDSAFDGDASEDEFAVRAIFGLERTTKVPDLATYQSMMEVITVAAIGFLHEPPIDIEKAAQEFLREKLMVLSAGPERGTRCAVKISVRNDGYGDITYNTTASIGYGSAIPSPFLDTAIAEARRREGYDEANKPMVLIEPPKEEPSVEQIVGDSRVITDRDTEIATGDFSDQSGDVEPADNENPF